MKNKLCVILSAVLLTACASAPSEVKKENDALDKMESLVQEEKGFVNKQTDSKTDSSRTDLEFAPLEQIRKSCKNESIENEYNVKVSSVRVSEGQTMPVYKLGKCFENTEDIGGFIKEFYGEDVNENKSKLCWYKVGHSEYFPDSPDRYTIDTDCKGALQYRYDEKGAIYASVSACGQFVANTPGCWEHQVASRGEAR